MGEGLEAVMAATSLESVIMLRIAARWVPAHSTRWRVRAARVKRRETVVVVMECFPGWKWSFPADEKDFGAS